MKAQDDVMDVPNFMFIVSDESSFSAVEECIKKQLDGMDSCAFLRSAAFTDLRRKALYQTGSHQGGIAYTGLGLGVKLFVDNRVLVKWM